MSEKWGQKRLAAALEDVSYVKSQMENRPEHEQLKWMLVLAWTDLADGYATGH